MLLSLSSSASKCPWLATICRQSQAAAAHVQSKAPTHRNTHSNRAHPPLRPTPINPSSIKKCVRNAVTPSNRPHASKRKETTRAWKIGAPAQPSHLPSRPATRPCETRASPTPVFTGRRRGWVCRQLRDGQARVCDCYLTVRLCLRAFCCVCVRWGGEAGGNWIGLDLNELGWVGLPMQGDKI